MIDATQNAMPCWVERWAAWGYEDLSDACVHMTPEQNQLINELANADQAQYGCRSDCDDHYCWCGIGQIEAMCVLDAGHSGRHVFVPPTRITLSFAPATES